MVRSATISLLIVSLLFSSAVQGESKSVRIATVEIQGTIVDFKDFGNPDNPFSGLSKLENRKLTVYPMARAVLSFCQHQQDILYPVVDSIGCDAELIKVFDIRADAYYRKERSEVRVVGGRRGFKYDLERLKRIFPNFEHVENNESDLQILKMLDIGRIDGAVFEQVSAKNVFESLSIAEETFKKEHYRDVPVYIAVNPHLKTIIELLKQAYGNGKL